MTLKPQCTRKNKTERSYRSIHIGKILIKISTHFLYLAHKETGRLKNRLGTKNIK